MAEGLARHLARHGVEIQSAGSMPTSVNPFAREVMTERGIDLTSHHSKGTSDIDFSNVDVVITLCADEVCPVFIGQAERLHWPFQDPAMTRGSAEDIRNSFRMVRNQIEKQITEWFMERGIVEKNSREN